MEHDDDTKTLHRLAGLATPMALRVAVTLGLPDRLLGNGASVTALAADLTISPIALDLLLAHLTTLGVMERTATGYRTTAYGANLSAAADTGLVDLLHLDSAGGRAAYPRRYGRDFWSDLAQHTALRESFDRQMAHRLHAQIPRMVTGFEWSRFATIIDVGGGTGTLLAAILTAHPHINGHLIDLEPTATQARRTFAEHHLEQRARVTAASFFDPLPAGGDAYLLVDILHDWDDENADRILARCVEAATPDSRIIVIEPVGDRCAGTEFNLAMLAIFGSRERRIDEFRSLAAPHDLTLETVTDLSEQRCLLEFRLTPAR
ncbi:Carminomycin 4-O-methyltransferase [Nocardia otitidiscaviarum]|uniref:Carminomycin 4-O-methyltransferase n=1 Tax=Nocardia otitidiscaviarum TaxID=1823 RepID=A0A378YWI9_9NOCA|nr:methyltransferase [Nocardia otitidiscaviarum]SUA81158.1 Carminomycin 4-O-methyltransferase [Nocardia otitidiscaviarum]